MVEIWGRSNTFFFLPQFAFEDSLLLDQTLVLQKDLKQLEEKWSYLSNDYMLSKEATSN